MNLDEGSERNHPEQDRRLAGIERDLARNDPALARRMARFNTPAAGHGPSWRAIGATLALLFLSAQTFLVALRAHNPFLFFASVVLFGCVLLPVTGRMHRRPTGKPTRPPN